MEVSTSLLVALMFVTLLSMGIGNTVNTFSVIIEKGKASGYSILQIGWLAILLLTYFNMFWHTVDLLSKESWEFVGFLYIMAGPIILYFATSILIASRKEADDSQAVVQPRFFVVFLLLQIWIVTVDVILGNNILSKSTFNIVLAVIVLGLIYNRDIKVQRYGLVAALAMILLAFIFRSLGIIS